MSQRVRRWLRTSVTMATVVAQASLRSVAALAAVAGRMLSGGDPETAAALLGRSEALGHDHPLHGVIQRLLVPMVDELLGAPGEGLRVALGRERLQSATARGAELDPAAAVALVHEGIHGIAAAGGSGA